MPIIACSVEDCGLTTIARGMCSSHYYKDKAERSGFTCFICGKAMWRRKDSKPQGEAAHNRCRTEMGGVLTHGESGYSKHGCRCDVCRAAKAKNNSDYRDRVLAKTGVTPSTLQRRRWREVHGYWPQRNSDIPAASRRLVYARDGWVCQICLEPISKDYKAGDPGSPSLDHIIPQSAQIIPDHSPENMRMTHMVCNSIRQADQFSDDEIRLRVSLA